jgi:pimeloyl-ACP methyl ester carboxylesterase
MRLIHAGGRARWRPAPYVITLAGLLAACGDHGIDGPDDGGEPVTPGCHDATLSATGALTRVCFPESWNGQLVVYAHGYVATGEPLAVPDDQVGGQSVSATVNGLGYAYATTSYRANGLVADLAAEDVAQLAEEVARRFRPVPSRSFVVGVSEGGLVAALAAEQRPDLFAGEVAACGPVGDFAAQIDYLGDFRVVFDYFFPGVIPGSPVNVPESVRSQWEAQYVPAVVAALEADPAATAQLLAVTGAPYEPSDPSTAGSTVLSILWYDIFALHDATERLGGQPYDNAGRVYQGSADDAALNQAVVRVTADAEGRAGLTRFETSGDLGLPLVTLHTTGDPIVPFSQEARYADKVADAGQSDRLEQRSVSRYGHCAFQPAEVLAAFAAMLAAATPAVARVD